MLYLIYLLLSFFIGGYCILIHHHAIHTKKWWMLTSLVTCGAYLKPFHEIHHREFLEGCDDFSWARNNQNFYKFSIYSQFKRRSLAGWKFFLFDITILFTLWYLLGPLYVAFVLGFTFHWELFEYWSHYRLKEETENKNMWSWNVLGKTYNKFLLGLGNHSKHHTGKPGYVPVIYGLKFYQFYMSYLPLFPNKFFKFMDKQIMENKKRGIL